MSGNADPSFNLYDLFEAKEKKAAPKTV